MKLHQGKQKGEDKSRTLQMDSSGQGYTARHRFKSRQVWPYLFILPFFVIYIAFNCYPLIYTFFISLKSWDGFTEPVAVGLENYKNIFTVDPYFLKSIGNTLLFMAFDIPIVILGGLLLASAFHNRKLKGANFFRTTVFLPYITCLLYTSRCV